MTYRELKMRLATLSEEQLNDDASIAVCVDAEIDVYALKQFINPTAPSSFGKGLDEVEDSILDAKHAYFILDL